MAFEWVAVALWLAVHLGLSGTRLRDLAVARVGETGFRAVFSVLALLTLYLLAHGWAVAKGPELWFSPQWLRVLLVLVMLPAFLLFVSAFRRRPGPPRGMVRVTRHPMLWSFALWGIVHMLGTGDLASVVFFGTFVVTALVGMPSIDAKQARRDPDEWAALSATTSIVPFQAIRQGRNRFVGGEIGWLTAGISVVLWAVVFWLHPLLFAVSPLL